MSFRDLQAKKKGRSMCGLFQKMKLTQKTRRWMRKPRMLRRDRLEFSYLSVNKIVIAIVLLNSSLFCLLFGEGYAD